MMGGSPSGGQYLQHPLHSSHTSQIPWDQQQVNTPVSEIQPPTAGYHNHQGMMQQRPSWTSHHHSHSMIDTMASSMGYNHPAGPPYAHSRQHSVPAITNWDQQKRGHMEKGGKMLGGDPYLPNHTNQNSVDSGVPATPSYPQEYAGNDDMDSPINPTNAGTMSNHVPMYHQSPMAKNIIDGLPGASVDTGEQMDTTLNRIEPSIQYIPQDLEQLSQWV